MSVLYGRGDWTWAMKSFARFISTEERSALLVSASFKKLGELGRANFNPTLRISVFWGFFRSEREFIIFFTFFHGLHSPLNGSAPHKLFWAVPVQIARKRCEKQRNSKLVSRKSGYPCKVAWNAELLLLLNNYFSGNMFPVELIPYLT